MQSRTVILASGNKGKFDELGHLLATHNIDLRLQGEFDVTDAEETGLTFVENAIIKARHAAEATGHAALADDSGIEVDALAGKPGIYSARFAEMHGHTSGDQANNGLLLSKLKGLERQKRTARFRCVLVLMRHAQDPAPLIADGSWEGHILESPAGNGGFGYDPLFFATGQQCAAAELPREQKSRVSHRGQALQKMLEQLPLFPF